MSGFIGYESVPLVAPPQYGLTQKDVDSLKTFFTGNAMSIRIDAFNGELNFYKVTAELEGRRVKIFSTEETKESLSSVVNDILGAHKEKDRWLEPHRPCFSRNIGFNILLPPNSSLLESTHNAARRRFCAIL